MRVRIIILAAICICASIGSFGQAQPSPNTPAPAAQSLPFPTQFMKTVVFITTNCVQMPTQDELVRMPPVERAKWTDEGIAKLRPEELARLKQRSFLGTGFIVLVPEESMGKDAGFRYLVTNRHVAQPGIEDGKPCKIVNYSFSLNHVGPTPDSPSYLQSLVEEPEYLWVFPDDDSVDLAATPFPMQLTDCDFKTIPLSLFVTQEMTEKGEVVEGDPVMFAGLFIQYLGTSKLKPVVRSGSIAMLPSDLLPTTLNKLGHIYLAEAHAFGGNSGSPMFVDVNKFKTAVGYDYRFLGVVTGEVRESADLTLRVTTSYSATITANSNISVIVPASEVKKLLFSQPFQQARDAAMALH